MSEDDNLSTSDSEPNMQLCLESDKMSLSGLITYSLPASSCFIRKYSILLARPVIIIDISHPAPLQFNTLAASNMWLSFYSLRKVICFYDSWWLQTDWSASFHVSLDAFHSGYDFDWCHWRKGRQDVASEICIVCSYLGRVATWVGSKYRHKGLCDQNKKRRGQPHTVKTTLSHWSICTHKSSKVCELGMSANEPNERHKRYCWKVSAQYFYIIF